MLHQNAVAEVFTSLLLDSTTFTMANNAKMFDIVISKLYSDKPRAIIRELWSNAYDSHIAAGKPDQPFECQLPTAFDATFRVRDFGVSLTHEDTMGLYTTVGASTKDKDNKENGKWGLGSKSPFAYGDTFTVTTWRSGTKRVYSAYRDSARIPRMALMLTEASDEPQGLEVAFPVAADDCDAFYTAAQKVALGFKLTPVMTGRTCRFVKLGVVFEEPGVWALCKADEGYFNNNTAYARQGCVVYPIDADSIEGITHEQKAVLRSPFFLEFAIGDLEITPSRESLGYDAPTCANILAATDAIIAVIRQRFSAKIAECTTFWEACCAFADLQTSNLSSGLKTLLTSGLTWRSHELTEHIGLEGELRRDALLGPKVHATYYSPSSARRRRQMKWDPSTYINSVSPKGTVIYFEDSRKRLHHAQGRVRYNFAQRDATSTATSLLWIKGDPTSVSFKRLYVRLGRPPMRDVATLAKPPVDLNGYIKKPTRLKALSRAGSKFDVAPVQESDDIIYVELNQLHVIGTDGRNISSSYVRDLRLYLRALGVIAMDTQIIGVPRACKNVLKRNAHWRSIWDVAKDAVAANFMPVVAARVDACKEITHESDLQLAEMCVTNDIMPASATGYLTKLIDLYSRISARSTDLTKQREWYRLAKLLDPSVTLPTYRVRWEPLALKVRDTYPMIALLSDINSSNLHACVEYVNLVDKS